MDDYAGPGVPSFGPVASDPLTPEHGVGFVDNRGPQCLCDRDFPYESGGWLSFNAHLRDAKANAEAELLALQLVFVENYGAYHDAQDGLQYQRWSNVMDAFKRALSGQAVSGYWTPERAEQIKRAVADHEAGKSIPFTDVDRGDAAKADRAWDEGHSATHGTWSAEEAAGRTRSEEPR